MIEFDFNTALTPQEEAMLDWERREEARIDYLREMDAVEPVTKTDWIFCDGDDELEDPAEMDEAELMDIVHERTGIWPNAAAWDEGDYCIEYVYDLEEE